MKVHREINGFEYWYDPSMRCWYAAAVDGDGNLGDSVNAFTRDEIVWAIGHRLQPVGGKS